MTAVTYHNGRQVAPVNPEMVEIKDMLSEIQQRQVRIETRLCVLNTTLGFSNKFEARRPPDDTQTL